MSLPRTPSRSLAPWALPAVLSLLVPLALLGACGDKGTTMNGSPDMAITLPPLFSADKPMEMASMACNGKFADPLVAAAMDTEVTGVVKDFQDDNLVSGAIVTLYATPDQVTNKTPIATSMPSAMDGTFKITVPKGSARVIRGVAGGSAISSGIMKPTIPAFEFGIRWDDKSPIAVKVATREALSGLISVTQMDGLGVVAGATHDCEDKTMGGANVTVFGGDGKTVVGQGPYYFVDAAGSTVPSRNAKYTGEGGVFASFNIPVGTAAISAVGVIGAGASVPVSKATVPVIADAITIIHLLPLAQ